MCGRFAQTIPLSKMIKIMIDLEREGDYTNNYNIAPSQNAFIISIVNGRNILRPVKWGLIPSWTKPDKAGSGLINARFETITEKASFKSPYKTGRCIVPVTGFYEWKKDGKIKTPYFISAGKDRGDEFTPMFLCGLYDRWVSPAYEEIETFTIITTEAAAEMKTIHDRMPLIIEPDNITLWLGKDYNHNVHRDIINSFDAGSLEIYRVSEYVNSPANNSPLCIAPIAH